MKLREMNKTVSLIFLAGLWLGCNPASTQLSEDCMLHQPYSTKTLFFVEPIARDDNGCMYQLYSSYFGTENSPLGELRLKNDSVQVRLNKLEGANFEDFFSFQSKLGTKNQISIRHRNWMEGKGHEFVTKKYEVILDSFINRKPAIIARLKIPKLIYFSSDTDPLNAVVFFSSELGFIGSYYSHDEEPKKVIEARGDVLEKEIDYSDYSFVVLK